VKPKGGAHTAWVGRKTEPFENKYKKRVAGRGGGQQRSTKKGKSTKKCRVRKNLFEPKDKKITNVGLGKNS